MDSGPQRDMLRISFNNVEKDFLEAKKAAEEHATELADTEHCRSYGKRLQHANTIDVSVTATRAAIASK